MEASRILGEACDMIYSRVVLLIQELPTSVPDLELRKVELTTLKNSLNSGDTPESNQENINNINYFILFIDCLIKNITLLTSYQATLAQIESTLSSIPPDNIIDRQNKKKDIMDIKYSIAYTDICIDIYKSNNDLLRLKIQLKSEQAVLLCYTRLPDTNRQKQMYINDSTSNIRRIEFEILTIKNKLAKLELLNDSYIQNRDNLNKILDIYNLFLATNLSMNI